MPNKNKMDDNILNDFEELEIEEGAQNETDQEEVYDEQLPPEKREATSNKKEELKEDMLEEESRLDDDMSEESILDVASDVSVNVTAVIGKTKINIRELLEYKNGTVIDLHRSPGETVDIMAGDKLIARGELIDMEGRLGVRILKVLR
jgi:flagellar motor switch protein FliN